ncbi:MAG: DUF3120 domain-containing protein [Leptolyngbyaceae cyanobacterium]
MSSFSPPSKSTGQRVSALLASAMPEILFTERAKVGVAAVFLVVVPVFFQAPLVRSLPWLSLALTGSWLLVGVSLSSRTTTRLWGDLLTGFTWTWLAGSLYWGWLRTEPFWHLPVETLGLPLAVLLLLRGQGRVGSYFFLGSLFGTAVTDLYIYWTDLLPMWRQVMVVDPEWVSLILQEAADSLQNSVSVSRGLVVALGLLIVGILPLQSKQACWWAFSGAVLSTLIVDLLFLGSAFCI